VDRCGDFGVAKADLPCEQCDMHAPFVFGTEPRRGAVDHDLALAQAEGTFVEQAAGEHLREDARAPGHGSEQQQRFDAGRHDAPERFGDGRFVGRGDRGDAGHATVYVARLPMALRKM